MFFRIKINVINMKKQRSLASEVGHPRLTSDPPTCTHTTNQLKNKGKGDTLSTPMHLTDSSFIYKYIRKRNDRKKNVRLKPASELEK